MTIADGFRIWFIALYPLGILSFVGVVIRYGAHRDKIEQQTGPLSSVLSNIAPHTNTAPCVYQVDVKERLSNILGQELQAAYTPE